MTGTLLAAAATEFDRFRQWRISAHGAPILAPGDRLDDVDLAAARLLLTITPADVGSASTATGLYVNDADGWY